MLGKHDVIMILSAVGMFLAFSTLVSIFAPTWLTGLVFGMMIVLMMVAAVFSRRQFRSDVSEGADTRAHFEEMARERERAERERADKMLLLYLDHLREELAQARAELRSDSAYQLPPAPVPVLAALQKPIEMMRLDGVTVPKRELPEELIKFVMADESVQAYPINLIDSFFRAMDPQPNRDLWKHGNGSYGTTARFIASMFGSPLAGQGNSWEWSIPHSDALAWWEHAITPWMVARGYLPRPITETSSPTAKTPH